MSKYSAMTKEDTYELIKRAQNGEKNAAERLIISNTGLVKSLALRFSGMGYETEDLIQIGYIGFLKAIERFDASKGLMLSTYAVPMIMGEIKRYMRDDGRIKMSRQLKKEIRDMRRIQSEYYNENGCYPKLSLLAERLGSDKEHVMELLEAQDALLSTASLDDEENPVIKPSSAEDAYYEENRNLELLHLKSVIGELPEKERQVIVLRYFQDMTQQQIAERIGISQVQVSRIEKRVLTQLKQRLSE